MGGARNNRGANAPVSHIGGAGGDDLVAVLVDHDGSRLELVGFRDSYRNGLRIAR